MNVSFIVEEAGCESCAKLVRKSLEPLGIVESIELDESADAATVRLDAAAAGEDEVNRLLEEASAGVGHAYRVRPGSWRAA